MNLNLVSTKYADNIAIVSEKNEILYYRDIFSLVDFFSQYFSPGSLVFIVGDNDIDTIKCYLGCIENNCPSLLFGSGSDKEKLQSLIDIYFPEYVFIKKSSAVEFGAFEAVLELGDYVLLATRLKSQVKINPDIAFLASTSGSTGDPKLVRFSKKNIVSNAQAISEYLSLSVSEVALAHLPINYSFAQSIINSHLYVGAKIFLTSKTLMIKEFWEDAEKHQVTSFSGVPFHYEVLLRMGWENLPFSSLRTMTQAGGKLEEKRMERVYKECQKHSIDFFTMYGQTEASPRISFVPKGMVAQKIGSIGIAIPGGKLWVMNESGQDVTEEGDTGELVYEGDNVCLGYANSREDLARGDDNQGILKTGDLASCDKDGFFFIKGRKSRFVKLFGNRVSLQQVESFVAKRGYDGVAQGADDRLELYIEGLPEAEIKEIRKCISNFIGVNFSAIKIIPIDTIPRFENGKVNYKCLKK